MACITSSGGASLLRSSCQGAAQHANHSSALQSTLTIIFLRRPYNVSMRSLLAAHLEMAVVKGVAPELPQALVDHGRVRAVLVQLAVALRRIRTENDT